MKKRSQIQSVDASPSAIPEWVEVAMAEIAENRAIPQPTLILHGAKTSWWTQSTHPPKLIV